MACAACYLGVVVGLWLTVGPLSPCSTKPQYEQPRRAMHPLAVVLGAAMYLGARLLLEPMVVPMTANLVML
jgi:hypothetical protein